MTLMELIEEYAVNRCEAVGATECAGAEEVAAANAAAEEALAEIQRRYDALADLGEGAAYVAQVRQILDGKQ
jgi:hypothetical protein